MFVHVGQPGVVYTLEVLVVFQSPACEARFVPLTSAKVGALYRLPISVAPGCPSRMSAEGEWIHLLASDPLDAHGMFAGFPDGYRPCGFARQGVATGAVPASARRTTMGPPDAPSPPFPARSCRALRACRRPDSSGSTRIFMTAPAPRISPKSRGSRRDAGRHSRPRWNRGWNPSYPIFTACQRSLRATVLLSITSSHNVTPQ
jgi:hypothetical protein